MTHSVHVKGPAMGLLVTGHSVAEVSRKTGIPKQTVSRWKDETFRIVRHELSRTKDGQALLKEMQRLGEALRQTRGRGRVKMGHKKRKKSRHR